MNKDELKAQYDKAESATDKFLAGLAARSWSAAALLVAVMAVIGLALYL